MSDDAYGWASSSARRDISRQVGPPSASTLTSSRRSDSFGAKAPIPDSPTKGLLFSRRRRAKPEVDRQAEKLDAVGGHATAQRDLAGALRRRDHEVGLAERPSAMKIHQVSDHGHEGARPAALADRLVGDVIQQRMHGEHDVGVVLLQEL